MSSSFFGYSITLLPLIVMATLANQALVIEWEGGMRAYEGSIAAQPLWVTLISLGLEDWIIGLGFTAIYLYPVFLISKSIPAPYPVSLFALVWFPFLVLAELGAGYYLFVEYVLPLTTVLVVFWYYTRHANG